MEEEEEEEKKKEEKEEEGKAGRRRKRRRRMKEEGALVSPIILNLKNPAVASVRRAGHLGVCFSAVKF